MKAGPILALVLLILVAGAAGYYYLYRFYDLQSTSNTTRPSTSCPPDQALINGACINNCTNGAANPPSCDSSVQCTDPDGINSHVYHPARLTLVKPCITASGIVDKVIQENDGDIHIRLKLDTAYTSLTNSANDQYQYGDLVVEIICVNPASQVDAQPSCQNYTNQILLPQEAQHITVTGPYVLDTEHYNWAEIHPVYTLKIDTSTGTTVHITSEALNIVYPDGSTNGWLGPSPRSYVKYVTVNGGDQFTDTLSLYSTSPNSEQIISITTTTPGFSIISISPSTPITFSPGETVNITLTIQSPNSKYHGSIELQIVTA